MAFFKSFNFVRLIILLSIAGSCVLGYLAWGQRQQIEELRSALARGGAIERVVGEIKQNALLYSELVEERDADQLSEMKNTETYIQRMKNKDHVELGQISIQPSERPTGTRGVVDMTYRITPADKDEAFRKTKIANFLFSLEQNSPQVRVTDIKISNTERRPEPEAIPPDLWTFEAVITSRQKVGE